MSLNFLKNNYYYESFGYFITDIIEVSISLLNLIFIENNNYEYNFTKIFNINANYLNNNIENKLFYFNKINSIINSNIFFNIFNLYTNIFSFFLIILYLFLLYHFFTYFLLNYFTKNNFIFSFFNNLVIIWFKFLSEKLESLEEVFLCFKFLPFFIFIFFTHFFYFNNFLSFFIFIEWIAPVLFGLIIITESIWLFSSYIFIYLNGSKGRKILLVSLVEDIIGLLILMVRIILQLIRGIICSLYHDFFKEIVILYLIKLQKILFIWNFFFFFKLNIIYFLLLFLFKILFIIILSTFLVVLMFLQALFLFLAVWLFCKCWFKSVYNQRINNITFSE